MSQVDFHILADSEPGQALYHACRLINKAYLQGHRMHVLVPDADKARQLDRLLWSFSDLAFVPHRIEGTEDDTPVPVNISIMGAASDNTAILINLSDDMPENYTDHERVIEIVPGDPASTAAARERYRRYRDQGHTLQTHKIGSPR